MSLSRIFMMSFVIAACGVLPLLGQSSFTDQGMFNGSGLTILPTATIAPSSEFRLQYSRLSIANRSNSGMNVIALSTGFSSNVEGYSRFVGEQSGGSVSQETYGFGLKVCAPFEVPLFRRVAVWVDRTISDRSDPAVLFPTDAIRYGAIATFDSNGIRPTVMMGMSSFDGVTNPLAGAGVTIAASHSAQIGIEAVSGYFGERSYQMIGTGSFRILPDISIQLSPGYLSVPGFHSWTVSLGLSCSTADIDFHPSPEQKQQDEFIIPSIEDIQRDEHKGQKNPGDGGALQPDQQLSPPHPQSPSDGSSGSDAKSDSPQNNQQEHVPHG